MRSRKSDRNRYNNPVVGSLLGQLQEHQQTQQLKKISRLQQQRKNHHSMSLMESKREEFQARPLFNNKTRKEGQFLEDKIKPIPYVFVPKYKNQTFIMPDRVFARGKAGKRFHIKMKDSAIYSFRDPESSQVNQVIKKDEKEQTIISRKVQEFNRIVDEADGVKKAQYNTWYLRNKKNFEYAHTGSEMFSQCQPLLGVKQTENIAKRKTSLAKTFDFSKKWRPNSRKSSAFAENYAKSVYNTRNGANSSLM